MGLLSALGSRLRATARIWAHSEEGLGTTGVHQAAQMQRRLKNWEGTTQDINSILMASGDTLIRRARQLTSHDGYARKAKRTLAAYMVGSGVRPSPLIEDMAQREATQALWNRWVKEADSEGQSSFYGLQHIAAGSMVDGGECFIRLRPRRLTDGLSVPLQLQMLESEYLDRSYTLTLPNQHQVKSGIEFDLIGRRAAYWFWRQHPGDALSLQVNERVRVPAESVIHVYEVARPGQIRGEPSLTPAMIRMKLLGDYDDAQLDRQRIAALFAGFVTSDQEYNAQRKYLNEDDPGTSSDDRGIADVEWAPGQIFFLDPGEEITFSNPADIGSEYERFQMQNLFHICSALNIPYHMLTSDVSKANYSSLRAALIDFRRFITTIQREVIEFQLCRRVWNMWVQQALLAGALDVDLEEGQNNVVWIPPKWEWVDPLKDRKAEQVAVEMGIKSRSAVIVEEGGDPVEVDKQRQADRERAEAMGVPVGQQNGVGEFEEEPTNQVPTTGQEAA